MSCLYWCRWRQSHTYWCSLVHKLQMCILYKHVFICVQKVTIKNLISKIYCHNILQKVTKRSKMVITNSSCCWCFDPLQIFKEHGQSSSIFLGLNYDHFLLVGNSLACLARHIWALHSWPFVYQYILYIHLFQWM